LDDGEKSMIEFIAIAILCTVVFLLIQQVGALKQQLKELQSGKQSLSTRYGQIFEQLVPFSSTFPGDPKRFRFLGDPIDGILFDNEKITFCEIKLNESRLSERQKKIKQLVLEKKVEWKEIQGK
jgi:predicted Holliday junction resolvase-like endonuclease